MLSPSARRLIFADVSPLLDLAHANAETYRHRTASHTARGARHYSGIKRRRRSGVLLRRPLFSVARAGALGKEHQAEQQRKVAVALAPITSAPAMVLTIAGANQIKSLRRPRD